MCAPQPRPITHAESDDAKATDSNRGGGMTMVSYFKRGSRAAGLVAQSIDVNSFHIAAWWRLHPALCAFQCAFWHSRLQ